MDKFVDEISKNSDLTLCIDKDEYFQEEYQRKESNPIKLMKRNLHCSKCANHVLHPVALKGE